MLLQAVWNTISKEKHKIKGALMMVSKEYLWPIKPPAPLLNTFHYVYNVNQKPENAIYIGRAMRAREASIWGNPYKMEGNSVKARIKAVASFALHLQNNQELLNKLADLKDKRLLCYCAPLPCHGHLLAALANLPENQSDTVFQWANQLAQRAETLPYRLLVTGSRTWSDSNIIANALYQQHKKWGQPNNTILVVGDAPGADTIAANLWGKAGFTTEIHKAEWEKYGSRAGMIRNNAMINTGVDACLAFSENNSPGTKNTITLAKRYHIPTTIIQR